MAEGTIETCPSAADCQARKASLSRAVEVKEKHSAELLSIPGVVGVGIGGKEDDARIVVGVVKLTDELLSRIPRLVEGVPVEILEIGSIKALEAKAPDIRPLCRAVVISSSILIVLSTIMMWFNYIPLEVGVPGILLCALMFVAFLIGLIRS